jgi:hypothetical protein
MNQLLMHLLKFFGLLLFCFSALTYASEPADSLVSLLDAQGGVATGHNSDDGHFLVAMGFSSASNEEEGYERARLSALKQLNEFINGSTISGYSAATVQYETNDSSDDTYQENLVSVVENSFKGAVSAASMLKKGRYSDDYFVAIALTESNTAIQASLAGTKHKSQIRKVLTKSNASGIQTVESKGISSLKDGVEQARERAVQSALRNAVQQAKGVMLSGRSGTFGNVINSALSTKTQGYVHSYEIINEEKKRGQYVVDIVAEVDTAPLLSDVNFYFDVLSFPEFYIDAADKKDGVWLRERLEQIGFSFSSSRANATHVFKIDKHQYVSSNHLKVAGMTTDLVVTFENMMTNDIILTLKSMPNKSSIYIEPAARAAQISEKMAYRNLEKNLESEVINALAAVAEQGVIYPFIVANANRLDWKIIRHTLENAGTGTIEGFQWNADGKILEFNYRYAGSLSRAMDEVLEPLYRTYKSQGKGRRLKAMKIDKISANFTVL